MNLRVLRAMQVHIICVCLEMKHGVKAACFAFREYSLGFIHTLQIIQQSIVLLTYWLLFFNLFLHFRKECAIDP